MYIKLINDGRATLLGPFNEIDYQIAWQTFPDGKGVDFDPGAHLEEFNLQYDPGTFRWLHSDRSVKGPIGDGHNRIGRIIVGYTDDEAIVIVTDAENGFIMNREGATIDRL